MSVGAKYGYNIYIHTHSHQFLSIIIQLHDENSENTLNPHFNLKLNVVFLKFKWQLNRLLYAFYFNKNRSLFNNEV
jgi:hypothetical protein